MFYLNIDDEEPASESLASRTEIYELYAETAKLRSLGVTHQVCIATCLDYYINGVSSHILSGRGAGMGFT